MKTKCPHCNQIYDLEDSWSGQSVSCPNCNNDFPATPLKPVMTPVGISAASPVVQTNVKQGAVIGAAACLMIAMIVQAISNFLFPLYLVLYLVAFILSIVAMAQRRVIWGLLILLATIIGPWIILIATAEKDAEMVKNAVVQHKNNAEKNQAPQ